MPVPGAGLSGAPRRGAGLLALALALSGSVCLAAVPGKQTPVPAYTPAQTLDNARTLAQSGQIEDAAVLLDQLAANPPADLRDDILFTRGLVLIQQGRFQAGQESFEELVRRQPAFFPARYMAGLAALGRNLPKDALVHFQEARKLRPEDPAAQLQEGKARFVLGDKDNAFKVLKALVEKRPEFIPGREVLAQAYYATGSVAQARQMLTELPKGGVLSQSGEALFAQLCLDAKDLKGALAHFRKAGALGSTDASVYHDLSLLEWQGGNKAGAQDANLKARALDANDPEILLQSALLARESGRDREAEETLNRILKGEGPIWQARHNLALLYGQQRRFAQAEAVLGPEPKDLEAFPLRLLRACLLFQKGNLPKAGERFEKLAAEDPGSVAARLNLGALLVLAGEPDQAVPHIQFALASGEGAVAPFLLALADSLLASQHAAMASEVYEMVVADHADDPDVLSRMALAALDAGDEKKAQELFARYDSVMAARNTPAPAVAEPASP